MGARTFKEKLRELVIETARGEDITEEIVEINSFDEDRCEAEYTKIMSFYGLVEGIKSALDAGLSIDNLAAVPVVAAELKSTDLVMVGAFTHTLH